MMTAIDYVEQFLGGVYAVDLNVSHPNVGSIFSLQHDPNTAVGALHAMVTRHFAAARVVLSTNGSTASNALMVTTAADEGEELIINRDAHVSVHGSLVISGAVPRYIAVPYDASRCVPLPPTADDVDAALAASPDARAVLVTDPSYLGFVSDTGEVVRRVQAAGKLALVDSAHGASLGACPSLPEATGSARPDLMSVSIHKTLCSLSQASVLLGWGTNPALDRRLGERLETLPLLSTSFSLPILMSIEAGLLELGETRRWERAVAISLELRRALNAIRGCHVVDFEGARGVAACDPLRILLDVSETGMSGYELAVGLVARQHVVEMATPRHVLFLVTSSVRTERAESLVRAVRDAVKTFGGPRAAASGLPQPPRELPGMELTPRQAFLARHRRTVPVDDAVGEVAAETICAFPPGAPIIVAGERFGQEHVDYLRELVALGGRLKGAADQNFETTSIIASTR